MNSTDEKSIRPFVFEQSFDMLLDEDEDNLKKEEEEEEVPTFSEEELQAACEVAYQEGMQAGLQQAIASHRIRAPRRCSPKSAEHALRLRTWSSTAP